MNAHVAVSEPEQDRVKKIRRRLFKWSRASGRDFWWRHQRDPFVTAVVEILLKQTRADPVRERARLFVESYPTPHSLAKASVDQLADDLSPFGFHRQRAFHLKELGLALSSGGRQISPDRDNLLSLPGIGPYTASAIRCFVYGASEPVVDVNLVRIVERSFGVVYERGEGRRNKEVNRLAAALVAGRRPREMNWALLDLGASVCSQRRPRCGTCPISGACVKASKAMAA